jgi:RNA polymerase sigma-70 factor (ECF subfamily)
MFIDGYKYKEIAEELNLPIGTLKSRIFFARRMMMETLSDFR